MTPKQKMNKKYPTKKNKEYYKFSQWIALAFKPVNQAKRKEEQKKKWLEAST